LPPVPRQTAPERWSAFVAPDLVPVFAETPWLDCPPGEDGQAALLSRLQPVSTAAWARCVAAAQVTEAQVARPTPAETEPPPSVGSPADEARAFLLQVMKDPQAALGHRIEAARALLAHG
jgi:hypothetical protein